MLMLLTILLGSLPVLVLGCALFVRLAQAEGRPTAEERQTTRRALQRPRFFTAGATPPLRPARIPVEALLSQIDRHIRLEQAAAESFLECPTPEGLRSRTLSTLAN
ncbi:MAG: hypothetical protein AB1505_30685 [Candidatus Latescibacterota bacterium]